MPGWLQGSYTLASLNAACQRSVNLFPEVNEIPVEKSVGYMRGTPGLATALLALPTYPLRGLFAGGSPLNPLTGTGGRMFAVAGSKLYEVFNGGAGIVTRAGTVVAWIAGSQFGQGMVGLPIVINGVTYTVSSVTNSKLLGLAAGAGNDIAKVFSTAAAYYNQLGDVGDDATHTPATMLPNGNQLLVVSAGQTYCDNGAGPVLITPFALDGTATTNPFDFHQLLWSTGDLFDVGMAGLAITFNGVGYTVDSVQTPTVLTLTTLLPGLLSDKAYTSTAALTASSAAFLDSFFIVARLNSKQLNVSAPNDGTSWDPLDVAFKESYPDNIGAILADHEELYVLGENRSEVWQAPGADPNFPFQRNPGACMSLGIAAPATLAAVMKGVAWLAGDTRGQPYMVYAEGFVPQRISTHAVEQAWAGYSEVADAFSFVYELDGHILLQISFPTGDATWAYDFTASAQMGKPMWHERTSFDGVAEHRHRASCHCYVFGKHWVGDFMSAAPVGQQLDLRGNIYEMDSDLYTDAGQVITCIRTLPHLCEQRLREFFTKLQIDLETGGGVALTIVLEWSDDGGTTFVGGGSAFTFTTDTAKTLDRAVFWQMGYADQGDRVFRITVTGDGRKSLINAYLDSLTGTS